MYSMNTCSLRDGSSKINIPDQAKKTEDATCTERYVINLIALPLLQTDCCAI